MSDGRTLTGVGPTPPYEGLYVIEVYFGWKLMEYRKGEWWHPGGVGRWTSCVPVQWVGPLPARKFSHEVKPDMEFDL